MPITPLSYEETLSALQGLMGEHVTASISDGDSDLVAASIAGPLRRAAETDFAATLPVLEGDLAGESMLFLVGEVSPSSAFGNFTIWKQGFAWGRLVDHGTHRTISLEVAGVQIRVRRTADLIAYGAAGTLEP